MNSAKKVVMLGALAFLMSAPCYAQDTPPAELSLGYNYLGISAENDNSQSLPVGWYADLAGNLNSAVALVGQATGNYKSFGIQGLNVDVGIHTFGGGLRFGGHGAGAAPFGQVLIGIARTSASSNVSGLLPFLVSESNSDGFLQFGAGLNVASGAPVGLRIGADYMRVMSDEGANTFRISIGILLPLGR